MAIFTIWRKIQKKEEDLRLILKDMLAKNENIRLYRNGLILSTLGEFSPSNIGPPLSTLEKEKKVAAATAVAGESSGAVTATTSSPRDFFLAISALSTTSSFPSTESFLILATRIPFLPKYKDFADLQMFNLNE